jgi:hypothetical protein
MAQRSKPHLARAEWASLMRRTEVLEPSWIQFQLAKFGSRAWIIASNADLGIYPDRTDS